MEFDEIVVKESPGLCRCCLSEGCYKDMSSEYNWMNDNEVYADMLLECFDISITQHTEGPNGPNRLICEVCITRLRDACNFKKQVLDSEMKFIDMMGRGEFRPKMVVYQTQTKVEDYVEEPENEGNEVEYLEDDITFTDDAEDLKDDPEPTVSDITVSSLRIKGKRGRPRKTEVKPEKKTKVAKIQEKPKSSKTVVRDKMADYDIDSKADSAKIKSYVITILQKSTAVPFKIHENQYKCFYCDSTFVLPSRLREHTTQAHISMNFHETLNIWSEFKLESNLMLDIQNLRCKVCNKRISNMNHLNKHLNEKHNEILFKESLTNVLTFKLNDNFIKCFTCRKEFDKFRDLLEHLRSHLHLICQTCNEIYSNEKDLLEHENMYCKPCSLCDMRFQSKKQRDRHLSNVHCSNRFECDFCSLHFTLKETLRRHIRNVHYKEKNQTCDVCGKTFFDTHYLNLHKVSHQNTKPFECDVCKKKFARNEALKLHKRIHSNDRRYSCTICGKSFVQWTSLNMHKVVHTDERNFKCPVCNRAFKDKRTMGKHCKNVHQKEEVRCQSNLYADS